MWTNRPNVLTPKTKTLKINNRLYNNRLLQHIAHIKNSARLQLQQNLQQPNKPPVTLIPR